MFDVHVATETDVDDVIGLETALFAEDSGEHEPYADIGWPAGVGAQDFADLLANPDAVVFVARADGRAIGVLMAYSAVAGPTRKPVRFAVLRSMYVVASHRRTGAARSLIEEFLDWARRTGCVEAQVDHDVANEPAGEFYESFGFTAHSLNRVLHL